MKHIVVMCALSLLIGGMALSPKPTHGAAWISGSDSYSAPWVKDIEQEMLKNEYWMIYANDPRIPQKEVVRLLNRAAAAQEAGNAALAQQLAHEALGIFEEGVRRHYYAQSDIEPIMSYIRHHMPIQVI